MTPVNLFFSYDKQQGSQGIHKHFLYQLISLAFYLGSFEKAADKNHVNKVFFHFM